MRVQPSAFGDGVSLSELSDPVRWASADGGDRCAVSCVCQSGLAARSPSLAALRGSASDLVF